MLKKKLLKTIISYQDFPKRGINFMDILHISEDPELFENLINKSPIDCNLIFLERCFHNPKIILGFISNASDLAVFNFNYYFLYNNLRNSC